MTPVEGFPIYLQFLRRFRQMEEIFGVLFHCTQQEICVVVQVVRRI
jgi:hypothetical protein